jgi:hypothetical protein
MIRAIFILDHVTLSVGLVQPFCHNNLERPIQQQLSERLAHTDSEYG